MRTRRITHMTKSMAEGIFVIHTRDSLFELNEITNSSSMFCPRYEFGFLPFGEQVHCVAFCMGTFQISKRIDN